MTLTNPFFRKNRKQTTPVFRESRLALILLAVAPALTFYLLEWYTHNPFETMGRTAQLLNLFFFEAIALLLFVVIGRLHLALMLETFFFAGYGLLNYFVLEFRSVPIQPWDLFSIRTAWNVAGNYSYRLDRQAALVLLGFLVLLAVEFTARFRLNRNSLKWRIPAALILTASLGMFLAMFHSDEVVQKKLRLYDKLFTPTTISYKNGTALAFVMGLRYIAVDKPAGYDPAEAAETLSAWNQVSTSASSGETILPDERIPSDSLEHGSDSRPNIIVIMNEAFSDPAVLGDFAVSEDYMPFVRSMMNGADNTISGWVNVSVLGGNTANTEFEYLTGHTMAFLPQGSVPYQQYISEPIPSMVSNLSALGYQTAAMHPYPASGWDRDEVYPWLGFEKSYFQPDFADAEYLRKYVSDRSDYAKVIECYEQKEAGQPLFLFNVTMQNHSSYTESFENFQPDVLAEGENTKALNMYLSLLKQSDLALQELIAYFETQEEDTLIVFFGDHQPNNSVIEPVLRAGGKRSSTLTPEEEADRYRVPFLIWANYELTEETDVETSINYLGVKTLEAAGLPLSGYEKFLSSLSAEIPVITARYMKLADGSFLEGTFSNSALIPGSVSDTTPSDIVDFSDIFFKQGTDPLEIYRNFQYYLLFDAPQTASHSG